MATAKRSTEPRSEGPGSATAVADPGLPKERHDRRLFIGPALWLVIGLMIFPFVFSLGLTFTDYNLFQVRSLNFVGFDNWRRLFADNSFRVTVFNTVFFTVGGVALQYVIGLTLALLVDRIIRFGSLIRVILLLPMMVAPIAVGFVVGRMMFGEAFGPINHLLRSVGLSGVAWTSQPWPARWTIILVDTWQWTPLIMLILLAGLQGVSKEVMEAARVDGATEWQLTRRIILPLLIPASLTAILIRGVEAFKIIDIIRVVTGGGPGISTESATVYVYNVGATRGDLGYASTAAFGLLILVLVSTLIFLLISLRFARRYQ